MATAPFTLVCGSDDFTVQRRGQELWAKFTESITDEFGRETVDGAAGTVGEVEEVVPRFISAVQTMPMFGSEKAVWLKNVSFLGDSVMGRSERTLAQLDELQNALTQIDPAQVKILITAAPVDKRKKGFKWFQKNGTVEVVGDQGDVEAVAALVRDELRLSGKSMTGGALEFLLAKVNTSPRMALEETRKLITYLGDEDEITENLVMELVPNFGEGDFFEAGEAFYSGDLQWALEAIHRHFFAGHDIRPLLAMLQNRNRLLIQLRVLIDGGDIRPPINKNSLGRAASSYGRHFAGADGKSAFNVFSQNPWYLGRLGKEANRFKLRQLIDFQTAFIGAFESVIERPSEAESIMRDLAVRCLGPREEA